jgi:hypothetical protein
VTEQPQRPPRTIAELEARLAATGTTPPPARSGHLERAPRRDRGKLHQADIPDFLPAPDSAAYHAALGEALRKRQPGNPLVVSIAAVGRAIFFGMTKGHRQTMAQIAKRAGCCVETVRKCVIFLEDEGLFGVLNVMVRVGRDLVRGANLYLAARLIDPASGATKRVSHRFAATLATFLENAAKKLHLAARPFGLNTTPLRQPGGT